jgi:hypothetical protein
MATMLAPSSSSCMATMLAQPMLNQKLHGNNAFTTPAEPAGVRDELYCSVCRLPIHNYEGGLPRRLQQWHLYLWMGSQKTYPYNSSPTCVIQQVLCNRVAVNLLIQRVLWK